MLENIDVNSAPSIRLNDTITVQTSTGDLDSSYTVTDVLSNVKIRMQGSTISDLTDVLSIRKLLNKPNAEYN